MPVVLITNIKYRSLGALRAPTSSLRPFGPALGPLGLLDIVLRALRALRPCDPRIVCALAIYDAIFFGNGRTGKEILGVGSTYRSIFQIYAF